jgi:hypothetical protein
VGSNHIDLELDLTFFEQHSATERKAMDASGDGLVSTEERQAYLARLAPTLARKVGLRVAGKELPLTLLYEPELDLPENSVARLSHHRLRIVCFAATPTSLKSGDEIVIEDRLWPGAKFLGSIRAEGRDGCKLATDSAFKATATRGDVSPPTANIKCLTPPRPVVDATPAASPLATKAHSTKETPAR